MQTLELETMRCELDGHLGRLRLNRPQALNAAAAYVMVAA